MFFTQRSTPIDGFHKFVPYTIIQWVDIRTVGWQPIFVDNTWEMLFIEIICPFNTFILLMKSKDIQKVVLLKYQSDKYPTKIARELHGAGSSDGNQKVI